MKSTKGFDADYVITDELVEIEEEVKQKPQKDEKLAIIALISDFMPNGTGEAIDNFFVAISALKRPKKSTFLYVVEGDSRDKTYEQLKLDAQWLAEKNIYTSVIKHDTGISPRTIFPEKKEQREQEQLSAALTEIATEGFATHFCAVDPRNVVVDNIELL